MEIVARQISRQELDAHVDRLTKDGHTPVRIVQPASAIVLDDVGGAGPVLLGPRDLVYTAGERAEMDTAKKAPGGAPAPAPSAATRPAIKHEDEPAH